MKLLRILQEREFERLGSNKMRHIDVRVIAATNQDLRAALEQGTFREDLVLPTERACRSIFRRCASARRIFPFWPIISCRSSAKDLGSHVESISDGAMEKLMAYHWPGNVRELENVIERSMVLGNGAVLDAADIKLDTAPAAPAALLPITFCRRG